VKKQSAALPKTQAKPEVGHLDVALTVAVSKSAEKLKRWWRLIVGLLAVLLASYGVLQGLTAWSEQAEAALNERLYRLFLSPIARKEDYKLDQAALRGLLADTSGSALEPLVYQAAVDFYLEKAEKLEAKAKEEKDKGSSDIIGASTPPTPPQPPSPNLQAEVNEARASALAFASEASQKLDRYPEIVAWAAKVKAKVEAAQKTNWLPPGWKFSPPPPKAAETPAPEAK